jgi:putative ABC transport system permease protein
VWRALRDNPGLAVVNALMVPTRNGFGFTLASDAFALDEIEELYIENETIDPIKVTVHDLKGGTEFELTVIGVLDPFASQGPLPSGFFTSTNTLSAELAREVKPSRYFFNLRPGTEDGAGTIESALFQHGVETIDVAETIADFQASQRSFFNLLIGFMTLGLVVGIAALGVISARAVVERRHEIGVLRAIGYSRRMVQMSFLAESSFIALLGIGLGVVLGLLMSINVMADIRTDEPDIELVIPWTMVGIIAAGAYLFSLLTTYLPSMQASRIAPADALRYE